MSAIEFDLVIRDGLIVDGSGAPGRPGDLAIADARIVAVGEVDGSGHEEIDADGHVVAPGFVDAHTHMDAQVFWDELGRPSCWHGVTTAVMGNCGFTLAPVHSGDRELVSRNIERAEDLPAAALAQGVPWTWSTFAEYLEVLDTIPKGINYAQSIGHSALRIWAMGERAFSEPATDDDLATMELELRDALRAGAAGLTTSRNVTHLTADGRPVASRLASWDEVVALVRIMGHERIGCFEDSGGEPGVGYDENLVRLTQLAESTGVPMLVPAPHISMLRSVERSVAQGADICGLTHSRGFCILQSFRTRLSFDRLDGEWRDVRSRPLDEQRRLLADPDVRARLVRAARHADYGAASVGEPFAPDFDTIQVMYSPYLPNPTVSDEARRRGVDPVEAMIDLALETDFEIFFVQIFPGSFFARPSSFEAESDLVDALRHPNGAMSFSDAGAHIGLIADASIQTHLLAYWVRERQALTLEEAIHSITAQPAHAWRLHDRGLLEAGAAADVTIFDPATVAPLLPRVVHDVPAGAPRLEQRATGYLATIVNGHVFTKDGEATEARHGRLVKARARENRPTG